VPPAPVPASAPATEFSAERALAHVREIAQRPHPIGSPDNARVRDYIVAQLRALGVEPQVQEATAVGTRYQEAGFVRNVLARLPGRTPGGQAVVLMAHYDGVAGGPAAGDDGAGTAAILETVRALRAGPQLLHDVMVVITDGEEAGLLGAAAFVREHPWAKDVGVTLNFEARGTSGRSYMFETGPGNLDVARMLRRAGDVSATSLSVTVYRTLPNDTDLSEVAVLEKPALNFAFADGVERYHTAHDDVAHLGPGSLQHHGAQMLALARAFGDGPLPRPVTGDGVFFDLPLVGLIAYPESWALPIAVLGIVLVGIALTRLMRARQLATRDVILGFAGTLVATCVAGWLSSVAGNAIVRLHDTMAWGGAPAFRAIYTVALALLALAVALAAWTVVRRWASVAGAHLGALVAWAVIAALVTIKLPGVSFLFAWPLIAGAAAAIAMPRVAAGGRLTPTMAGDVAVWVSTVVGTAIVVPVFWAVSAVMLGAAGPGGIATGVLVGLLAWLLAPQLDAIGGQRWRAAGVALMGALVLTVVGLSTIRSSPDHPTSSIVAYAVDADSTDAWVGVRGAPARELSAGSPSKPPAWLSRMMGRGEATAYLPASRVAEKATSVSVVADSTVASERTLTLRVVPTPDAETVALQADSGTRVARASVDGRSIDPSRYRIRTRGWRLTYNAPPADGFVLALTVPAGAPLSLDVTSRTRGLPPLTGVKLPPRPPDVVTIHTGDVTLVHQTVKIP
jgi:hypothetical protein